MKYKTIKLNSARNCLRYIIKAFNIKEIYIPYYLCSAIRAAIYKENCKINFYHIDENFKPTEEFNKTDYILYPDYWGICSSAVKELSLKYPNLIIDNAHSFYSEPEGIACFNSLRKFFPELRDGAILHTQKVINTTYQKDNYEYIPKIPDYKEICINEQRIDYSDIKLISKTTETLFNTLDIKIKAKERLNKFYLFHSQYKNDNLLNIELKNNQIPFCYPILAKDINAADKIAKSFEEQHITICRYWNNLPDSFIESIFYKQLVAIPLL